MSLAAMYMEWRLESRGEPVSGYLRSIIDLGTLAGLHEHQHELHAYCPRCDRWRTLPLAELVAAGFGSRRLPVKVRCRDCGETGQPRVRPPVPARSGSVVWIEVRRECGR